MHHWAKPPGSAFKASLTRAMVLAHANISAVFCEVAFDSYCQRTKTHSRIHVRRTVLLENDSA